MVICINHIQSVKVICYGMGGTIAAFHPRRNPPPQRKAGGQSVGGTTNVGQGPKKPRAGRSASSRTHLTVWLCAPVGRLFLHIRTGSTGHRCAPLGVCRLRYSTTMGDQPGKRVNHDDLPTHLLRIAHSRRCSAAPFSVVDGQQSGGVVYQKSVAVQHTIFVVGPADVNDGIRPIQDRMIEVPR